VIVLVNRFSASASEIVAGALQDLDAALVMGETTFGKGLVQVVRRLPHDTAMKMTIAHYTLPSGRTVPTGEGIVPDVETASAEESELEAALRAEGAFFLFAGSRVDAGCGVRQTPLTVEACMADEQEVLAAFSGFLEVQGFSYTTSVELDVDMLLARLEEASWPEALGRAASLQSELQREKERDLERHSRRLLEAIEASIMSYLLEGEALAAREVAHDPLVAMAAETLQNNLRTNR